jgi:hypothetical protein
MAIEPGEDHPLAIGTEMRYFPIYDPMTATPKKFKKCLEDDRYGYFLIHPSFNSRLFASLHLIC